MDLGFRGKRALVCAAHKGLGRDCGEALASERVHVTVMARRADVLQEAADEIRQSAAPSGPTVTAVACDIATMEVRRLPWSHARSRIF